jgi:hypothetical protein
MQHHFVAERDDVVFVGVVAHVGGQGPILQNSISAKNFS